MGKQTEPRPVFARNESYRNASTFFAVLFAVSLLVFASLFFVQAAGRHLFASIGAAALAFTITTGVLFLLFWVGFDLLVAVLIAKHGSTLAEREMHEGAYEHHADNLRRNRAVKWGTFIWWLFAVAVLWIPVGRYGYSFNESPFIYAQNDPAVNTNATVNCTLVPRQIPLPPPIEDAVLGLEDIFSTAAIDAALVPDRCGQSWLFWITSSWWVAVTSVFVSILVTWAVVAYQQPEMSSTAVANKAE
jgi:hypothetical protein